MIFLWDIDYQTFICIKFINFLDELTNDISFIVGSQPFIIELEIFPD